MLSILLLLGIGAILFGIAHDVAVFRYRTELAYDYVRETVPDYLDDEKEFIYGTFLPELITWAPQHELFQKIIGFAFWMTLGLAGGMVYATVANVEGADSWFFFICVIDAALMGTYFTFFRPRKYMLYSKMDYYDAEIQKIKETAN